MYNKVFIVEKFLKNSLSKQKVNFKNNIKIILNKTKQNNMKKMTQEQFNDILTAFQTGKNNALIHMGIRLIAGNDLHLDYLSEIPEYMKTSLCRKVLRYVAQTALKGTMEIDGLASSCSFCEIENGHAVSFGNLNYWSFWSHRLNERIDVEILISEEECFQARTAKFYDYEHDLLMEIELWPNCHWTQSTGRIDLMQYFDDVRNPLIPQELEKYAKSLQDQESLLKM